MNPCRLCGSQPFVSKSGDRDMNAMIPNHAVGCPNCGITTSRFSEYYRQAEECIKLAIDQWEKLNAKHDYGKPVAWIRGHITHTEYGLDYDEEVVPGSDCPEGKGWVALFPERSL